MATTAEKSVATATANTISAPAAASAANSSVEPKPKKTVDSAPPSMAKSDPPNTVTPAVEVSANDTGGSKTSGTTVAPVAPVAGDSSGPVNDMQKKIRRAERFGVPVQLSEQEKRNSRAERFGTAPSPNGSEASKKSEELKRKARAERFGLAVPSTPADEEAKKKARLARFAPYSKIDTVEEEKRKARAIRFSNSPSSSLPEVNGKGNIEPEAPIAGKAGGGP